MTNNQMREVMDELNEHTNAFAATTADLLCHNKPGLSKELVADMLKGITMDEMVTIFLEEETK
jgi:hypothetical protein